MIRVLSLTMLVLSSWINLSAQVTGDCPDWTNGTIKNPDQFYFGVGSSNKSQKDADDKARENFALMVQLNISSRNYAKVSETKRGVKDEYVQSTSITTEQSLRGINISERWNDSAIFWSLIKMRRDDFWELQEKEGSRASKQKIAHAQTSAQTTVELQKIDTQTKQELLRNAALQQQLDEQERAQKAALRRAAMQAKQERRSARMSEYGHFSRISPARQVVSSRNGKLLGSGRPEFAQKVSLGFIIDPLAINNLGYSLSYWLLESSLDFEFLDNQLEQQEFALRMQILPGKGTYYTTSIAIGAVEYLGLISEIENEQLVASYSPTLSGTSTIPHWRYSLVSFYCDARMITLGINNYPFFSNFGESFNVAVQVNYIKDAAFRNRFNEKLEFEIGLQFMTIENLTTILSYEDHEFFKIRFEYVI